MKDQRVSGLPWTARSGAIYSVDGEPVADCLVVLNIPKGETDYEANANMICLAVNEFGPLVEALRNMVETFNSAVHPSKQLERDRADVEAARAVLERIEGGK